MGKLPFLDQPKSTWAMYSIIMMYILYIAHVLFGWYLNNSRMMGDTSPPCYTTFYTGITHIYTYIQVSVLNELLCLKLKLRKYWFKNFFKYYMYQQLCVYCLCMSYYHRIICTRWRDNSLINIQVACE